MKNYVTVKELLHSDLAKVMGIDNSVKDEQVFNNLLTVAERLSFVRLVLNSPIYVNSGYRCERLNKEVKGVKNSLHMKGLAADIRTNVDKMERLRELLMDHDVRKMLRIREVDVHSNFIHVGFLPYDGSNNVQG